MYPDKNKIKIAAIVGPTASGKTALSIEMAKKFNGEIISCDSMQIYRKMNIGTAKPNDDEKCGIPHHMIDVCEPTEKFSCSDYTEMATKCIIDIVGRGKLPILCGGTGLYLDSVLRGIRDDGATEDKNFREKMEKLADIKGADALHNMLSEVDPEAAISIHKNNIRRVIRALEVYHTTGKTKTQLDRESKEKPTLFDALIIGLEYGNREILYSRINKRVDIMIESGLVKEAKDLYDMGILTPETTAGQAIGYKELLPYLSGNLSLEDAIDRLKLDTRHYAKRQMTWFMAKKDINWIQICNEKDARLTKTFEEIVNIASNLFHKYGFGDIMNKR